MYNDGWLVGWLHVGSLLPLSVPIADVLRRQPAADRRAGKSD